MKKSNSMKKKHIMIYIFLGVALFVFINTFIQTRNECKSDYNFTITKLEITPTKRLIFYDNEKEVSLWNYIVSANTGVDVGDKLIKGKCSKYLYIYKKNDQGEYFLHLKVKPSGLFPIEWFCNK